VSLPAYLALTGQAQGPIKGSVTQRGHLGEILVFGMFHQIVAPRDPARGTPTGKRIHKPYAILKVLDQSSPLLYRALTSNENLTFWRLRFYRPTPDWREVNIYTVTLTDATVSGIRFHLPTNKNAPAAKLEPYEEVQFTYRRIDWAYNEPSLAASDDWETPRL
jgi:type VI secretion system secreted protein Hcp